MDRLELFISLHEAKNGIKDVISSCVTKFGMSKQPLSTSDIHAIGSVLHHCIQLSHLALFNCSLTGTALEVLASCLEGSQVKVRVTIPTMVKCYFLLITLTHKSRRVKYVFLQITGMFLSANKNMGINGMSAVGNIIQQCEVSKLELLDCDLSCKQLQALDNSLRSVKVDNI